SFPNAEQTIVIPWYFLLDAITNYFALPWPAFLGTRIVLPLRQWLRKNPPQTVLPLTAPQSVRQKTSASIRRSVIRMIL
ncbi:MAG TPA: hypothetical protein VFQ43_15640, partial [Nitrososphaera sp.]|nr:hypothetical protein [Nitrososphaera sp.]